MSQPPTLYRSLSKTFVLTSVAPLLLLSVVILYHLTVTYTQEIKEKNQLLARALSGQIEAHLQAPLILLNNLRYQLEEQPDVPRQWLFAQHVTHEPLFDSIYLLDVTGRVSSVGLMPERAKLQQDFIGLNLAHLDFYQQALRNRQPAWSKTFHSLITSNISLAVCVPLQDGRALVGNINIDFLQKIIEEISLGERVDTAIIDQRGEIIAFSNAARALHTGNLLHLQLIQSGLAGKFGSGLYLEQGASHLGSVAQIDGPGWVTLISQPTGAAYRPIRNAGLLFGVGLIGMIGLVLIFSVRKARRIAAPFNELSAQAGQVAEGNYALPPIDSSYQEVEFLQDSFHQMALAIRDREQALSQREKEFRTLAENLPAMVYRIQIQDENRLLLLNSRAQEMTGYSNNELMQGGTALFASRIPADDFSVTRDLLHLAISEQENYSLEYRFNHKLGQLRFFTELGTPVFDAQGELLYLDGVIFDVTEERQAAELLLQNEKMLSVGGLAAGMAHEINNPLAGILLNMEMIRNRLSRERDVNRKRAAALQFDLDQLHRYLQESRIDSMLDAIDEATRRTAKIVENVLSFSRKGGGTFVYKNITELIDQTLALAEHHFDIKKRYDFKKINIVRKFHEPLPLVNCEPGQIQQVLLNILENGAQAMFEETSAVRQPELTIEVSAEGQDLQITISDNGPGMEEPVRRRVFEPFFTTKETGHGTGLGLSVSYFIITKNHRGSLSVESQPGLGSTFSIHLPVDATPQPAAGR